jgi:xanthine dehydrogenase small subunit
MQLIPWPRKPEELMKNRDHIVIFLNGQREEIKGEQVFMMVADFLRYQKHLTGTKIVCAEGDCGACTVLILRPGIDAGFVAINSCIVSMAQLDGAFLLTVEALKLNGRLSVVQEAIVEKHGSQCGYCTPGFAMAMTALFEKPCAKLTSQRVKNCLTGNLCRCTGYEPLIEAALAVDQQVTSLKERFFTAAREQELIAVKDIPIHLKHENKELRAPATLAEADRLLSLNNHKLFCGATDLGVLVNKGKTRIESMLSLHLIKELYEIKEEDERIIVGARVTLSEVRNFCKSRVPTLSRFINIFASPQIKNMATLAGNVANGSPIADTIPFMMVNKGKVHVRGTEGQRTITMKDFYVGYKTLSLNAGEYISHLSFALPSATDHLRLDKVSQRKDLDIATINSAFFLRLENSRISKIKIAVGGIGPIVKRLKNTENFMKNKHLTTDLLNEARTQLQKEIAPQSDLRGSDSFRRVLTDSLFTRFFQDFA